MTSTMCKVLEHILQERKITYIGKKKENKIKSTELLSLGK